MPQIIPIRDLKDTTAISSMCHKTEEPIFITKNGYGDMVIMSMKTFEEKISMSNVYAKIAEAENDIASGKKEDALDSLKAMREKLGV